MFYFLGDLDPLRELRALSISWVGTIESLIRYPAAYPLWFGDLLGDALLLAGEGERDEYWLQSINEVVDSCFRCLLSEWRVN